MQKLVVALGAVAGLLVTLFPATACFTQGGYRIQCARGAETTDLAVTALRLAAVVLATGAFAWVARKER